MSEEKFQEVKDNVLGHIQSLFEEMEEELALSHQEKYALLEDALNSASDEDELRVAFEHWYNEHADEIGWDFNARQLWNQAIGDTGLEVVEDHEEDDEEEVKNLEGFGSDEEEEHKDNFKDKEGY